MQAIAVLPLYPWENFYVIIGSAAAGLTGLMFIVITLIAGRRRIGSDASIAAFGTPNVVHFCAALLVAALLSAPWQTLWPAGLLLSACGLSGIVYIIITARRAHRQTNYQPVLEDWLWHTIFPFISYSALVITGLLLSSDAYVALFGVAASTLLFLFIGIHNAWDSVTYITIQDAYTAQEAQQTIQEAQQEKIPQD